MPVNSWGYCGERWRGRQEWEKIQWGKEYSTREWIIMEAEFRDGGKVEGWLYSIKKASIIEGRHISPHLSVNVKWMQTSWFVVIISMRKVQVMMTELFVCILCVLFLVCAFLYTEANGVNVSMYIHPTWHSTCVRACPYPSVYVCVTIISQV